MDQASSRGLSSASCRRKVCPPDGPRRATCLFVPEDRQYAAHASSGYVQNNRPKINIFEYRKRRIKVLPALAAYRRCADRRTEDAAYRKYHHPGPRYGPAAPRPAPASAITGSTLLHSRQARISPTMQPAGTSRLISPQRAGFSCRTILRLAPDDKAVVTSASFDRNIIHSRFPRDAAATGIGIA